MSVKFDGYLTVLFVKDLDRVRDFYENVIGLECDHGDERSASFSLGPDGLLLVNHAAADDLLSPADVDHEDARGARSVQVTVVDDVDAAYAELRAKGVEFIRAPEDRSWGMRCAHFKDPEGNVWEIHKRFRER
ncbi:MAG: glyoxalase superfamily protein [Streptosporangiaceae bacterium]